MPKYDAVLADASPLISLEKLPTGLPLLQHTFCTPVVPEVVLQEVSSFLPHGSGYFDRHGVRRLVAVEIVPFVSSDSLDADLRPLGPVNAPP